MLPAALASPGCVACEVDAAAIRREYSDGEWKQLESGEIVTAEIPSPASNDTERRRVRANGIIRTPAKQVWSVLTDFPSRPEFIPDVEDMAIVRVDGKRVWVDERLGFLFVEVYFRAINTLEPERGTMSWELDKSVEHDIDDTRGVWQLVPVADGAHTLIRYWADVDTGQPIPGFIERYLRDSSLPKLLGHIRDEAERRFVPASGTH